jgi:hypothetical protein
MNRKMMWTLAFFIMMASFVGKADDAVVPAPVAALSPEQQELFRRGDVLLKKVGHTPGLEFALRLNNSGVKSFREQVTAGKAVDSAWARYMWGDISNAVARGEEGIAWPIPSEVAVPYAGGDSIVADGRLDEEAWKRAVTFDSVYPFNSKELRKEPATTWKLLWDDKYLYVAYVCADTNLLAETRERDSEVWKDDAVEIFLMPDLKFRTYWELIVSPAHAIYDSVQCKQVDQWGAIFDPSQNIEGLKVGLDVRGELNRPGKVGDGYTVELAIPFDQVPGYTRAAPKTGDRLWFMLVRLDRTGSGLAPYAFQPLLGWGHNIWNHAPMRLVKDTP